MQLQTVWDWGHITLSASSRINGALAYVRLRKSSELLSAAAAPYHPLLWWVRFDILKKAYKYKLSIFVCGANLLPRREFSLRNGAMSSRSSSFSSEGFKESRWSKSTYTWQVVQASEASQAPIEAYKHSFIKNKLKTTQLHCTFHVNGKSMC